MKKNAILFITTVFLGLAILNTACKKEITELQHEAEQEEIILPNAANLKSATSDSLLCVRIEDFLDNIKNKEDNDITFDSATYYLEASVNYHYGRGTEYGSSLTDSFDVTMDMTNSTTTTYGDAGDTRDDIVDGLKAIYDDISDTTKFMIFAMVHPITQGASSSTYRVYAGFGWGDYVEYDEDAPYDTRYFWHWETEAPQAITYAAMSVYGYIPPTYPSLTFYSNIAFRSWDWNITVSPHNWVVYQSELSNYNGTNIGYAYDNYMDYDSFWQQRDLFNPTSGLHDDLSGTEINFYVAGVKSMIDKSYGHPGGGREFCHMDINPNTLNAGSYWKYKYHHQLHWFGKPRQQATQNYQKSFDDWGI